MYAGKTHRRRHWHSTKSREITPECARTHARTHTLTEYIGVHYARVRRRWHGTKTLSDSMRMERQRERDFLCAQGVELQRSVAMCARHVDKKLHIGVSVCGLMYPTAASYLSLMCLR